MSEQTAPRHLLFRAGTGRGLALEHERPLLRRHEGVCVGRVVEQEPQGEPHEAERTGHEEGGLPAIGRVDPRDYRRGDDRADRSPGLHDAMHEGPLAGRIPLAHRLEGGHEVARLPEPEQKPQAPERPGPAGERMEHVCRRPPHHEPGERPARAEAVDEKPGADIHHRVGGEERREDVGVLRVSDAEFDLEHRREHRERLPVDVVDHRREKQQPGDPPAEMWDLHRCRLGVSPRKPGAEATGPA